MANALSFITLAEAKAQLPIRAGNVDFDARLRQLVAAATAQIQVATRREFDKRERVEFVNARANTQRVINLTGVDTSNADTYQDMGSGTEVREQMITLAAPNVDPDAEFEVRYDPSRVFDDDTVVDSTLYSLNYERGQLYLRSGTFQGVGTLRVRYTAGYAVASSITEFGEWDSATLDADTLTHYDFNDADRQIVSDGSVVGFVRSRQSVSSGGVYVFEVTINPSAGAAVAVGIAQSFADGTTVPGVSPFAWFYLGASGNKSTNGTPAAYGSTFGAGDVITVFFDATVGAVWFAKNGTLQNGATLSEIEAGDDTNAAFTGVKGGTFYAALGGATASVWGGMLNAGQDTFTATQPDNTLSGFGPLEDISTMSASAPDDLKLAATIQTVFLFKKLDPENVGSGSDKKQRAASPGAFLKVAGITPEVAAMVAPYKRLLRGSG